MKTEPRTAKGAATPELAHQGFFLLRTPLLPQSEFFDWSNTCQEVVPVRDGVREQLGMLRAWLSKRWQDPVLREAIYLASPSLFRSLEVWERNPDSEQGRKAELSLVRYFARMTSRPTPFGLFAGCSLGQIGSCCDLRLSSQSSYVRKTRLDHAIIYRFLDLLLQEHSFRETLRYRRNDTLTLGAGRWRHAEVRPGQDGQVSYHLVATERSPYLDAVLQSAREYRTFSDLVDTVLASSKGASASDASAFIHLLIGNQLLCSELSVPVTGDDPLHALSAQLSVLHTDAAAARLADVRNAVAALDGMGLGIGSAHYATIDSKLTALLHTSEHQHVVQVDLWKPVVRAVLPEDLIEEICQGVSVLARLRRKPTTSPLSRFKESFQRRYEGQQVPLLLALDPECGIGFDESRGVGEEATALIGDLTLRPLDGGSPAAFSGIDQKLLSLLNEMHHSGQNKLELPRSWIDSLLPVRLPDAMAVLGSVFRDEESSTDCPSQRALRFRIDSASGPSAASLLGRFCHSDPALQSYVHKLAKREQDLRPDELLVEIAHRMPGRTGNIALRPVLRDHELEVLGRSGAAPDRRIALDELTLFLHGDELWLYCERLGKRLRPRLSNAHNYAHPRNLHLYRFLCALHEDEGTAGLSFHFGALSALDALPRVTMGRLVFSPARWRIDPKELSSLGNSHEPLAVERTMATIQKLRTKHKLPRHVQLVEGDNSLLCDFDNPMSVLAFVDYAKNRPQLVLEELLGISTDQPVHGPEGGYVNEVVIPLVRTLQTPPLQNVQLPAVRAATQRTYPPGSEWLYCKFYTGMASAERILLQQLAPLVPLMRDSGVDRWFFIRYADPDWHLRLRLHGDPSRLLSDCLPRLSRMAERLISDGQCSKFQIDTYDPEWERYGGAEGLGQSEELFWADSEAALAMLPLFIGEGRARQRWHAALLSMAALLADFFPRLEDRLSTVSTAYESFRREFAEDPSVSWRLGARFRSERLTLEQLLSGLEQQRTDSPLLSILAGRSQTILPITARIQRLSAEGRLNVSLPALVRSYLHMTANRVLRSAARPQELALYDFLGRLYRSMLARSKA